jgi:hypothetical protein
MESAIALEGELLGGLVAGNMHVARKGDLHCIVGAAARGTIGLEQADALAYDIECRELVEKQIAAPLGRSTNGRGVAGGHPQWRMRLLPGRRFDQDVVERPEASVVREAFL